MVLLEGKEHKDDIQHPKSYGSLPCGSPYSGFAPKGLQVNLWGQPGGSNCDGEEASIQHSDLGRPSSYLHSSPNQWLCSSVEQSQGHSLTRELGGCRSLNLGPQMSFTHSGGSLPYLLQSVAPAGRADKNFTCPQNCTAERRMGRQG